jgi:transposase
MAVAYIPVDRDQLFLLPPNMRDWLTEDHLAWFILEVVDELDTAVLHERHPHGVGRAAYDPDMFLALVLYSYCQGVLSSREMARLCEVDVAFRVICANHRPHHGTISRFIAFHQDTVAELFVQVLAFCRAEGMARLGAVAIDGTKMGADASLGANRSRATLEAEVAKIMRQGAATDAAEDRLFGEERGDELPEALADPATRTARIQEVLRRLRAEQERAAAEAAERASERAASAEAKGHRPMGRHPAGPVGVAEAEATVVAEEANRAAKVTRREARRRQGKTPLGPEPKNANAKLIRARKALARARQQAARKAEADTETQTKANGNVTDPDSRIMRDAHGGTLQGYNAQAAVSEDQVVVAAEVTNEENDYHQLVPLVGATRANLEATGGPSEPDVVLADAGYCTEDNLTAPDMPDLLIATAKRRDVAAMAEGHSPPTVSRGEAVAAMTECLGDPRAAAAYARRSVMVEPVFADVKDRRRIRGFRRRGLRAVDAEWKLICMTHNLIKVFRHRRAVALAFV